ncbi:MAG: DUF1997 domain-containing protein [Elainellaceae cyanobacterium]
MPVQFASTQTVKIAVHEQPVPIQHYLRQPHRLIGALVDPSRTERLSAEVFRLKMRSRNFMMFSIQPTVDMRLWVDSDGTVHLESVGCKIRGIDYVDQRFNLDLVGELSPRVVDGETYLVGQADLSVQVELPPPLRLTPKPLLEATGNGLLRSVLTSIKQRLMHQLLSDYRKWAMAQGEADSDSTNESSSLLRDSPTA